MKIPIEYKNFLQAIKVLHSGPTENVQKIIKIDPVMYIIY